MSETHQGATAPTTPYEHRAFPFRKACKEELGGICENTGLKLVRAGTLETFKIGARRFVTGAAIIACKKRLAVSS